MRLSIIIPVRNEAAGIVAMLARLAPLRERGAEIIVVDGGSSDGSAALATPLADRVLSTKPGRARQMHAGAIAASGEALLFLHADTVLPPDADALIAAALRRHVWGRFDVKIDGQHPMFRIVETMMNLRSRATGIATGDQAIFIRRADYEALGGYAQQPLMEDIEFSARARRLAPPACLHARVCTSARRWQTHGIARTILLMWRLRLAYFLGADPRRLALAYGYRVED
ncbi:TIGR04283 family arsenosugar biosynthesis glycosyltransferase [Noviherbaspirillum pedocola]|uniref:TIGR04283 family arsenosugar biosynthesis glycosyltransferase n=1 Tax=Noviherbaspirillum pedocola TaxID=2801341 RepID=A0A934W3W9_9BURK|nr:TIGR04283 family arsenosugar biosynthesis glycosyltransferase [Noviherbaspirillum pedocola]MBK4733287.1 TIGR04283 family arsenosugar biosynthesis glycosyltransferase [Noviherbaspirillum pedocola]